MIMMKKTEEIYILTDCKSSVQTLPSHGNPSPFIHMILSYCSELTKLRSPSSGYPPMSTSLAMRGLTSWPSKEQPPPGQTGHPLNIYYKPSYLDHYLGEKMERVNQWRRNVDIQDRWYINGGIDKGSPRNAIELGNILPREKQTALTRLKTGVLKTMKYKDKTKTKLKRLRCAQCTQSQQIQVTYFCV